MKGVSEQDLRGRAVAFISALVGLVAVVQAPTFWFLLHEPIITGFRVVLAVLAISAFALNAAGRTTSAAWLILFSTATGIVAPTVATGDLQERVFFLGGLVIVSMLIFPAQRVLWLVLLPLACLGVLLLTGSPDATPGVPWLDVITTSWVVMIVLLGAFWFLVRETTRTMLKKIATQQRAERLAERLAEANADLQRTVDERTAHLKRAIEQRRSLVAQLQELTLRDPMTGLWNRRFLAGELPSHSMWETTTVAGVILLDLDNFKRINDTYLHAIGDEVLCAVARTVTQCLRPEDVVMRFGGEEFLVVLPAAGRAATGEAAERIRVRVESLPWTHFGEPVTLSAGVGWTADMPAGLDDAIEQADGALRLAKSRGRNRVEDSNQMVQAVALSERRPGQITG